jgi:hypothetical protein
MAWGCHEPGARRCYALLPLTLIYRLNFLDRTVFNVLMELIKMRSACATARRVRIRAALFSSGYADRALRRAPV